MALNTAKQLTSGRRSQHVAARKVYNGMIDKRPKLEQLESSHSGTCAIDDLR